MSVHIAISDAPALAIPVKNQLLENLAELRQEWEAAAEGVSLLDITASVGLMLLDITTRLGLSPEERSFVLGAHLGNEVLSILDSDVTQ